jgi:hypothetical protein
LLADRGGARGHAEESGEELKLEEARSELASPMVARAANENPAGAGPAGFLMLKRRIVRRGYWQTATGRPRQPTTLPYMS